jgi:ATP-binding cassette subfamily B protein
VTLMRIFREGMRARTKEYRTRVESLSARLSEMVDMIPITRAHGVEEVEIGAMTSRLEDVRKAGFRLDIVNAWFGASTWVTMQTFQLLCLVVTGLMALRGMIPVGDVVMYQGFFAMMIGSVSMFLNMYPQLNRGAEAVTSIGEVLDCPDIERNFGKKPVPSVRGELVFDRVGFTYPTAASPAVRDINLRVEAGECIALVGESGAGKSTILNLIIGFRRPTEGRILLDGIDMEELDLRQFRSHLAVVTQQTILFSGSLRENIAYGLRNAEERKIREAIEMANAAEFIDRFPLGLDTPIGESGKMLSGGQQQRIAIARALIRDPRVIILDEATSSLDVIAEFQVQQAIERLIKGRTTFVVAHRLSTIRIANRVIVMKAGAVAEAGTHDELMARKGEFFRLRSLQ